MMNNVTRIVRNIIKDQNRVGLKSTIEGYFRDPNQYVESDKEHLQLACLRWFSDLTRSGSKPGWKGRIVYECALEIRNEIQWHLIVDKTGRLLSDNEVAILSVHEDSCFSFS